VTGRAWRALGLMPCNDGGMVEVPRKRFEELVGEALDQIPDELAEQMDNVAVFVEDEPEGDDGSLLGEYIGIPLTERFDYTAVMPDRINIYRGPLLRLCHTEDEIIDEVYVTVVHEVAHHFGIDDEQLHRLGWA
jgi:predicted Zn-dependent protease with MMP-like domain